MLLSKFASCLGCTSKHEPYRLCPTYSLFTFTFWLDSIPSSVLNCLRVMPSLSAATLSVKMKSDDSSRQDTGRHSDPPLPTFCCTVIAVCSGFTKASQSDSLST